MPTASCRPRRTTSFKRHCGAAKTKVRNVQQNSTRVYLRLAPGALGRLAALGRESGKASVKVGTCTLCSLCSVPSISPRCMCLCICVDVGVLRFVCIFFGDCLHGGAWLPGRAHHAASIRQVTSHLQGGGGRRKRCCGQSRATKPGRIFFYNPPPPPKDTPQIDWRAEGFILIRICWVLPTPPNPPAPRTPLTGPVGRLARASVTGAPLRGVWKGGSTAPPPPRRQMDLP